MSTEKIPNYSVILPCSQDQFGEFVSKLLGRPQRIGSFNCQPFDIGRAEIKNTYHLVDQRLQQNNGTLVEFVATIGYHDGTSISLNSLVEFLAHRETRPLISQSLNLSWVYLVQFPQSAHPEKQTIEMKFLAERIPGRMVRGPFPDGFHPVTSAIGFEISHTSRTWGSDIEGLLIGHIGTLTCEDSGARRYISKYSGWIGVLAGIVFLVLATLGGAFAAEAVAESQVDAIASEGELANSIPELSGQIRQLSAFAARGTWHKFGFFQLVYFALSLALAVVLGAWVGTMANNPQPSFLVLTDQAAKNREKILRQRKRDWIHFGVSGVTTMAAGVMSRVAFYFIAKWWLS